MRVTIPLIAVLAILIGVGGAAVLPDKPADETPDAAQPVATGDVYHADPDPDYVPTTVVDVAFAPYLQPYLPSAYHAAWGGFQELTALPVPSQAGHSEFAVALPPATEAETVQPRRDADEWGWDLAPPLDAK